MHKEDSGGVLWVFLHGPNESDSVEKPLFTFLSIKKYLKPGLYPNGRFMQSTRRS